MTHAGTLHRFSPRRLAALTLAGATLATLSSTPGCGGAEAGADEPGRATLDCPAPIGAIASEDCEAVSRSFSAVPVDRALTAAGRPGQPAGAADAVRRTGAVAEAIQRARVGLCRERNACRITDAEHAERDARLGDEMAALVALWDARSFRDASAVARYAERLEALAKVAGVPAPEARPRAPTREKAPPFVSISPAVLAAAAKAPAGLQIRKEGGRLVIVSEGGPGVEILRTPLAAGAEPRAGRALVRILGGFAPREAPLFAAGDVLTVRFMARASAASEVMVALRSVEDEELGAREGDGHAQLFELERGKRVRHEVRLTAPSGASGLYVALGIRGEGAVELDGIEVLRGGSLVAEARAEQDAPAVQTRCAPSAARPLEGRRSLACVGGEPEAVRIGFPAAYATFAVHRAGDPGRPIASMRTTSLEGGRTLDVATLEGAELAVSVAGPGSLTVERIEVQRLAK